MLQRGIERVGTAIAPEEVLDHVLDRTGGPNKKLIELQGYQVNVASRRLFIFKKKGTRCVSCGIRGERFYIEKFKENTTYHLNLYAVKNGVEILMTRDHVWARGLGSSDSISNQVTMCHLCNRDKSQKESHLANANSLKAQKKGQKKKAPGCRPKEPLQKSPVAVA